VKKKWIVVIVLVIVVVGVAAYFIGQGGFKSEEERLIEEMTKPLDVSVPKGYFVDMPPEVRDGRIKVDKAKVDEEALGQGTFDFEVEVTNQSNQVLEYGELAYTIYDGDGQPIGETNRVRPGTKIRNLGPRETIMLHSQSGTIGIGTFREVSKFEYTLRNLQWSSEESASLPEQVEEGQIEEEEQPEEKNVYTASNYPKNPQTPGEVVVAFAFLCDQKKYTEAERFCTQDFLEDYGRPKQAWSYISQGEDLKTVKIIAVNEFTSNPNKVDVAVRFYFKSGRSFDSNPQLIKEKGEWRLNK